MSDVLSVVVLGGVIVPAVIFVWRGSRAGPTNLNPSGSGDTDGD